MSKKKITRNRVSYFNDIISFRVDDKVRDIFTWVRNNDKDFISDSHFIRTAIETLFILRTQKLEQHIDPVGVEELNNIIELLNVKLRDQYNKKRKE